MKKRLLYLSFSVLSILGSFGGGVLLSDKLQDKPPLGENSSYCVHRIIERGRMEHERYSRNAVRGLLSAFVATMVSTFLVRKELIDMDNEDEFKCLNSL